ncbi:MAG: hypothetical protein ACTSQI_16990 [Candidatus Helarchaeota archaeon]
MTIATPIPIDDPYTPDLQKALKLLKKNANGILAYKKVNLPLSETRLRINCEWEMRKGKRSGLQNCAMELRIF